MDAHLVRVPSTQPSDSLPLAMPSSSSPASASYSSSSEPTYDQPPTGSILTSLDLEEIDPTVFRSVKLWTPAGARGAFGGQVIGQALNAATKTVGTLKEGGKPWGLHSQHVRVVAGCLLFGSGMLIRGTFWCRGGFSVTSCSLYRRRILSYTEWKSYEMVSTRSFTRSRGSG
jgi:hypothetical protein